MLVIEPGPAARTAMGANPLDPAIRILSAKAGLAQAVAVAGQVNSFWNGNSKYLLGHVFDTFLIVINLDK
ncbi:MAG: hypothetical protein NVS3B27_21910 [Novosphingobium sp.]